MPVYKSKYPTKDGKQWYFSRWYSDLNGNKKKYTSKKEFLERTAKDEENKFIMKISGTTNSNITLGEIFNSYILFKEQSLKPTSIRAIEVKCLHLKSLFKIKVQDFKLSHFNQWKFEINKKKLSTTHKNSIYKLLKSLFIYANMYLDISNSEIVKFTNFTNATELKKEMLFFTIEEFKKFISVVDDLTYKTFFETLYYCGLRQGEAQALTWNDIKGNEIIINKSLTSKIKGKKYIIMPPKNKSSIRTLPITTVLQNSLRTLQKEQSKMYGFNNNYFIFGGAFPLATTTIQVKKNNYCKKAGVKQIRIHDFRHSTASLLLNSGANITLVAKYLGHSNIATTLNTYSHMFKNQLDEIVKIIERI